jgi:hypothetical protein
MAGSNALQAVTTNVNVTFVRILLHLSLQIVVVASRFLGHDRTAACSVAD